MAATLKKHGKEIERLPVHDRRGKLVHWVAVMEDGAILWKRDGCPWGQLTPRRLPEDLRVVGTAAAIGKQTATIRDAKSLDEVVDLIYIALAKIREEGAQAHE